MLIVSLSVGIYHWKQIISHDVHFDPMERSLTTQFILKARNYMKSNDPRHFEEETQGTTAGTSCRRVSLRPDYAMTYKLQCNIGNSSNGPSTVPFSIPKPSSGGFREGSGGSLYFHGMIKSAKRPPHTFIHINAHFPEILGPPCRRVHVIKEKSNITYWISLKGTATLMITMFYMKDLNKPWILNQFRLNRSKNVEVMGIWIFANGL